MEEWIFVWSKARKNRLKPQASHPTMKHFAPSPQVSDVYCTPRSILFRLHLKTVSFRLNSLSRSLDTDVPFH